MENRNPRATKIRVTMILKVEIPTLNFLDNTSHAVGISVEELAGIYLNEHCLQEQAVQRGITKDLMADADLFAADTKTQTDRLELSDEAIRAINGEHPKSKPLE